MLGGHDHEYVRVVWVVASALGIAMLVALVTVYRRAVQRHELEQAERIIADDDEST
jgi:hypothetical protein